MFVSHNLVVSIIVLFLLFDDGVAAVILDVERVKDLGVLLKAALEFSARFASEFCQLCLKFGVHGEVVQLIGILFRLVPSNPELCFVILLKTDLLKFSRLVIDGRCYQYDFTIYGLYPANQRFHVFVIPIQPLLLPLFYGGARFLFTVGVATNIHFFHTTSPSCFLLY